MSALWNERYVISKFLVCNIDQTHIWELSKVV